MIAAFALTAALCVHAQFLTFGHPYFRFPGDHHKYIYMAQGHVFTFHVAPFCWRVAEPLLASLLPFGLQTNFLAIAFVSIWLTGVTMFHLSKLYTGSVQLATLGLLLFFTLWWATRWLLFVFWLPDAPGLLVIALATYCLLARHDGAFAVVLIVGVCVKETALFALPLFYGVRSTRLIDPRIAARCALLGLPAFAVLVALHISIAELNGNASYMHSLPYNLRTVQTGLAHPYAYNYWQEFTEVSAYRWHTISAAVLGRASIGAFGLLVTLFAAIAIICHPVACVRFLPFLVLVYAQLLFAVDVERLLIAGAPAVILIALRGAAAVSRLARTEPLFLAPLPVLFIVFALERPYDFAVFLSSQLLVLVLGVGLLVLVGAVADWRHPNERHAA